MNQPAEFAPTAGTGDFSFVRNVPDGRAPGGRGRKYEFLGYFFAGGDEGDPGFRILERRLKEGREEKVRTGISLPVGLLGQIAEDGRKEAAAAVLAGAIRRALDERGVKIYFDGLEKQDGSVPQTGELEEMRREPARLRPKWKYRLGQKFVEDNLSAGFFPAEILALALEFPKDYKLRPKWRSWFGPKMQAKRDEIISRVFSGLDSLDAFVGPPSAGGGDHPDRPEWRNELERLLRAVAESICREAERVKDDGQALRFLGAGGDLPRMFRWLVEASVGREIAAAGTGADPKRVEAVGLAVEYFVKLLIGGDADPKIAEAFRNQVAEVDPATNELKVKNIEKLAEAVKKVYGEIADKIAPAETRGLVSEKH